MLDDMGRRQLSQMTTRGYQAPKPCAALTAAQDALDIHRLSSLLAGSNPLAGPFLGVLCTPEFGTSPCHSSSCPSIPPATTRLLLEWLCTVGQGKEGQLAMQGKEGQLATVVGSLLSQMRPAQKDEEELLPTIERIVSRFPQVQPPSWLTGFLELPPNSHRPAEANMESKPLPVWALESLKLNLQKPAAADSIAAFTVWLRTLAAATGFQGLPGAEQKKAPAIAVKLACRVARLKLSVANRASEPDLDNEVKELVSAVLELLAAQPASFEEPWNECVKPRYQEETKMCTALPVIAEVLSAAACDELCQRETAVSAWVALLQPRPPPCVQMKLCEKQMVLTHLFASLSERSRLELRDIVREQHRPALVEAYRASNEGVLGEIVWSLHKDLDVASAHPALTALCEGEGVKEETLLDALTLLMGAVDIVPHKELCCALISGCDSLTQSASSVPQLMDVLTGKVGGLTWVDENTREKVGGSLLKGTFKLRSEAAELHKGVALLDELLGGELDGLSKETSTVTHLLGIGNMLQEAPAAIRFLIKVEALTREGAFKAAFTKAMLTGLLVLAEGHPDSALASLVAALVMRGAVKVRPKDIKERLQELSSQFPNEENLKAAVAKLSKT